MSAGLTISGLTHSYGSSQILHGVSLDVAPAEIVALLGPSGSGKSTCLRLVAGLEPVQHGSISVDGEMVGGEGRHIPAEKRRIGLVLQDYALFPHMTVRQNVAFGIHRMVSKDQDLLVEALLDDVGMSEHADSYPHTLSGGQQQRIALVRALAPSPRIVLMDEPFSGLDVMMREEIGERTIKLVRERQIPTLVVTHDPAEAFELADRIAVMQAGRIIQFGTVEELYRAPVDPYVMRLFGAPNRLDTIVESGKARSVFGTVDVADTALAGPVTILFHPSSLYLADAGEAMIVETSRLIGGVRKLSGRLGDGTPLRLEVSRATDIAVGARVHVAARLADFRVFPRQEAAVQNIVAEAAQ